MAGDGQMLPNTNGCNNKIRRDFWDYFAKGSLKLYIGIRLFILSIHVVHFFDQIIVLSRMKDSINICFFQLDRAYIMISNSLNLIQKIGIIILSILYERFQLSRSKCKPSF